MIAVPDLGAARPLLGVSLQPDPAFLHHNRALLAERAELFEVTPETVWRAGALPGPRHAELLSLVRAAGRPVTGHGVLFGLGAAPPDRRAAWLAGLRRDRDAFGFAWFSEHLGWADHAGAHSALPLPLPPTEEAAATVAASLAELRAVTPIVAFENNADLFCLGEPLQQTELFAAVCERADAFLVLDLHNAFAFCRNLGVELDAFLERVPWQRVLEIHLSGGNESDPDWLASRRVLRLDSHDGAVPETVWRAFERSLPRAPNLRAVVLEWLPDGFGAGEAAVLAADFERARAMLC
ncbi:MAG: DUF692 family protein [Planctomycetes bacterium]|nr:DUF692 family protein [Planctomycetota bacterium]